MTERGNRLLRSLDYWAGIPLALLTACGRRLGKRREKSKTGAGKKIGVLCLGAIGDLLLLSGLIRGIRRQNPGAFIELIGTKANAQALPLIPEADSWRSFSLGKLAGLVFFVRSRCYDIFIDSSQWARIGAIIANLSGAKTTVGFWRRGQWRASGYDLKVGHSSSCHELQNFLSLGRSLWPDLAEEPQLKTTWVGGQKRIFMHMWPAPGQGRIYKLWPEEHWASLANILRARGFELWLTGSKADQIPTAAFMKRHFPDQTGLVLAAGQYGLAELAMQLAKGSAMISVNTGIMHLAAIMGLPTVALNGATNPARWGAYGSRAINLVPESGKYAYLDLGHEYDYSAEPALASLPPEAVLMGLERLKVL